MTTEVARPPERQRGPSPRQALGRMLSGNQVQQAIYALTRLGIPELLAGGPRTSDDLAAAAGANADSLHRLLRALTGFGVVAADEAGRFGLTEVGELLRPDVRGSMSALALWSGGTRYRAFGELEHTVRTGEAGFEHLMGTDFWSYLAADREARAQFDAMTEVHTAPVAQVIARRDFGGARTVVDVGGGRGDLIAAILAAHDDLAGVLVEHTGAVAGAHAFLGAAGVADRCPVVEADIVAAVPAAGDVYVMKNVVHGMPDADAVRVIENCLRAGGADARLLLVELVIEPGNGFSAGKLMDLLMLVGGHGRERTEAEFATLLGGAGARLEKVAPAPWGYSVIEAAVA